MKPVLKDVDFDSLASDPDLPRWRNAAQWARAMMVKEGLLKAESPRGVWEISDKGQARLKEQCRRAGTRSLGWAGEMEPP